MRCLSYPAYLKFLCIAIQLTLAEVT
uniref:Uncharacterized protein n=1 Tax=Anguilla anguilla TaxID=7936 RepID=A0A0E9PAS8_ANGAN